MWCGTMALRKPTGCVFGDTGREGLVQRDCASAVESVFICSSHVLYQGTDLRCHASADLGARKEEGKARNNIQQVGKTPRKKRSNQMECDDLNVWYDFWYFWLVMVLVFLALCDC